MQTEEFNPFFRYNYSASFVYYTACRVLPNNNSFIHSLKINSIRCKNIYQKQIIIEG